MFNQKDHKLIDETIRLINQKAKWDDLSSSDAVVLYNCFLFLEDMRDRIEKNLELQAQQQKQREETQAIAHGEVKKNEGTVKPKPSRRKKVNKE